MLYAKYFIEPVRVVDAEPERAGSVQREMRLPVLVVMPGKELVVAHRLSMDRSATAGAPLPAIDDYVFHKTSSTADRARTPAAL